MSEQTALLDLEHKSLNPYWIDPMQPLIIPKYPLHWKAHKLQLLMETLDKQASKNPAQFNSKNYIDALSEYTRCIDLINKGVDDVLESDDLGEERNSSTTSEMGSGASAGMDSGVSADNPFSGQGLHPTGAVPVSTGVSELPGQLPSDQQAATVRNLDDSGGGSSV